MTIQIAAAGLKMIQTSAAGTMTIQTAAAERSQTAAERRGSEEACISFLSHISYFVCMHELNNGFCAFMQC